MINVGILGATGYVGEELISILLGHPHVRITSVCSSKDEARPISKIFPKFKDRIDLECAKPQMQQVIAKCDLVFLALPHTVSTSIAPKLLKAGKKVIDLSADYRLKNAAIYEKYYKTAHKDKENLKKAVYGLPELYRAKIRNAKLIANPGCYPTASLLGLSVLVAFDLIDTTLIIIDAKSGVTGAGRKADQDFFFSEINEDFKPYKVNVHQHIPEINQELSKLSDGRVNVTFVPHLLPINRGILVTIYVKKGHQSSVTSRQSPVASRQSVAASQKLVDLYRKFYKKEPFVRIRDVGDFPKIKDVSGTNFCDIGIQDNGDSIIIIAAIDNLLKGASGQAVQNMNIMYDLPEKTGLL